MMKRKTKEAKAIPESGGDVYSHIRAEIDGQDEKAAPPSRERSMIVEGNPQNFDKKILHHAPDMKREHEEAAERSRDGSETGRPRQQKSTRYVPF